ncbi:MAG: HRDC domain-containing protein, partial [Thiobacillaceae bacterium]
AARKPATLTELGEISGLGVKKIEAYGEDVLAVVAEG